MTPELTEKGLPDLEEIEPADEREIQLDKLNPQHERFELHPNKKEKDEWKDFKESVGRSPRVPLQVKKINGTYRIIDGHRRYEALKENGAREVECEVYTDDQIPNERVEHGLAMEMNEQRMKNDQMSAGRMAARFCEPWLLRPEDRFDDWKETQPMSQSAFADFINKPNSQGTISTWLDKVRNENPLRHAIASYVTGRGRSKPDGETIQLIELVYRCLRWDDIPVKVRRSEDTTLLWTDVQVQDAQEKGHEIVEVGSQVVSDTQVNEVAEYVEVWGTADDFDLRDLWNAAKDASLDGQSGSEWVEEMNQNSRLNSVVEEWERKKEEERKSHNRRQDKVWEDRVNNAKGHLKPVVEDLLSNEGYNMQVVRDAIDSLEKED